MGPMGLVHRAPRPSIKLPILLAGVGLVALLIYFVPTGGGSADEPGGSGTVAAADRGDSSRGAEGAGGLNLDLSPVQEQAQEDASRSGAAQAGAEQVAPPSASLSTPAGAQGRAEPTEKRPAPAAEVQARAASKPGSKPASKAPQPDVEGLRKDVEKIIANAVSKASKGSKGKATGSNCAVAVMAVDVESGQVLIRRQASLPLIPASNLKLITVAAALGALGPNGAFSTRFEAHGKVRGGVLEGDLVVRAGGDPLYRSEGDGSIDPWLKPLAQDLKKAGIQRVTGALVLDEGSWLEPGPGPEWPAPSQHWKDYCALAGGFSVNGGSFRATVTPVASSGKVDVVLRPRHHGLKRRGSVKIGSRNAVNVGANSNGVTVKGTIPAASGPLLSEFSAPDPVDLFGHAFVGGLGDEGVAIEGGFVRTREVAASGPVVHTITNPITTVFPPILQDSHNALADQLFLTIGAQVEGAGTRKAAAKAVKDALEKIGVPGEAHVQVDGSGLSKANRTSATHFVALVSAVMKTGGETARVFLDALPVAGESGTLSSRMRGTIAAGRVRAKTGWVSGASALSGVAETEGGRTIAFSILVSYPRVGGLNRTVWKPMQDEICESIVGWGSEASR